MNSVLRIRLAAVGLVAMVSIASLASAKVEDVHVNHDYVVEKARELAAKPYEARQQQLPISLRKMTYDEYRRIRFVPQEALWQQEDTRFKVQFFHPGALHQNSVVINEYTAGYAQRIPFVRSFFDYQDLKPGRLSGGLDYAGFKIIYPLNEPEKMDELISFLGASYFRALGSGHYYGISARGLAINSGGPDQEEFPAFFEFWLGKPAPEATSLTFHALLDSISVAGAYTFVVKPDVETMIDVHATLFFRSQPAAVGYAPMTSMFWYGENSSNHHGDFRPEVHDSDGLLIATGGETRIWRPLEAPVHVRLTDFPVDQLAGFGLMQRDRDFENYQDTEAHYHQRPSLWMEPVGVWPEGVVRLLELPTGDEYQDNMGAFWRPVQPPAVGQPMDLRYTLRWTSSGRIGGPAGYVAAVRRHTRDAGAGKTLYVVDFSLADFGGIPEDATIVPNVSVPESITVEHVGVQQLPNPAKWRLTMHLKRGESTESVEIRAGLLLGGTPITETVALTWTP